MFAVDQATAEAIRRAYDEGGELSGIVEFQRHFPLMRPDHRRVDAAAHRRAAAAGSRQAAPERPVTFTLDKLAQAMRGMPREAPVLIELPDGRLAQIALVRPGPVGTRDGRLLEASTSMQGSTYAIVLVAAEPDGTEAPR